MDVFTLKEARAFLHEHALPEAEKRIYEDVVAVIVPWEQTDESPVSLPRILAHLFTNCVGLVLAHHCPGDAQQIAETASMYVQLVESLLQAKIIVTDGFVRRKPL